MDNTTVKVHPNGAGARKKNGRQSIGRSRGGLTTKIHMVAADDHTVVGFSLSGGEAHDAPEGRKLLEKAQNWQGKRILVMDKAYEGDETREKAAEYGYCPVVPPKSNRKVPWEYDKILYKRRNEIEIFSKTKEIPKNIHTI